MFGWFRKYWKNFRFVISLDGSPYLYRYRLWRSAALGVYLHNIVRADRARDLHDHPFDFTTIILWGGYWEHGVEEYEYFDANLPPHGLRVLTTRKTRVWRGPGSVIRHKAADLHRVELTRPAWTLFIRGPRVREWGFATPEGWVQHKIYTDREKALAKKVTHVAGDS